MSTTQKPPRAGFTIVELLIVIVVIAILAAVSIVAYTGIQQRAKSMAILAAVDQWSKAIAVESLENAAFAASPMRHQATCLGSASDFPAADGFDEGVCLTGNLTIGMAYNSQSFADWSNTVRPLGTLPVTELSAGDFTLRARGIWIYSFLPSERTIVLAWIPQVSGECGRGNVVMENTDPLAGGYCSLAAKY